jgi:hypothetical protein
VAGEIKTSDGQAAAEKNCGRIIVECVEKQKPAAACPPLVLISLPPEHSGIQFCSAEKTSPSF